MLRVYVKLTVLPGFVCKDTSWAVVRDGCWLVSVISALYMTRVLPYDSLDGDCLLYYYCRDGCR